MTPREHDTGVSRARSNPNGDLWGELSDDNLTLSAAPETPAPRPRMTPLRARPAPAGDVRILVAPRRARGDTVDHMSLAGGHSEVAERSRHRAAVQPRFSWPSFFRHFFHVVFVGCERRREMLAQGQGEQLQITLLWREKRHK